MKGKWDDVFVLAGPTASGKSTIAVELAEKWGAEIIGADAYQVYRGLRVLTAQPEPGEMDRVRHHLIGVLDQTMEWSAADFARAGTEKVEEIRRRGNRIIVAGGSGFYLEALFDGLPETPPPDPSLRKRLSQATLPDMVAELIRLDPAAATVVDLQNPRRLQRAIEIVAGSGRPFASFARSPDYSVRGMVLSPSREWLQRRIEQRVGSILDDGAIEEVRQPGARSATCAKAIGLGEISDYLAGKQTLQECRERIVLATRQYAKRQMTWFRNRARWELVEPQAAVEKAAAWFLHSI